MENSTQMQKQMPNNSFSFFFCLFVNILSVLYFFFLRKNMLQFGEINTIILFFGQKKSSYFVLPCSRAFRFSTLSCFSLFR